MKRKQLQALCKQHGLPAGKSNLQLADSLAALLLPSEERSKRGGCLRGSGGSSGEGRGTAKKVSFSIEDEKKVRPDRRKRIIDAEAAAAAGLDSPDAGVVPVRRTRSRSLGDAVVWSPGIQKKARKGTEGVRRNAELDQDEVPVARLLRNKAGKGTEGVRQNAKVFVDEVPAIRSLRNRIVMVSGGEGGGVQRDLEPRGTQKRTRTAETVDDEESPDLVVYNEDGGDARKVVKKNSSRAPATRSLRSRDVVVGGEKALLPGEFESRRTRKRSRLANVAEDVEASPNGGAMHKQPEAAVSTVVVVSEIGRPKVSPLKEAPLRRSRRTLSKPESSLLENENPGTGKAGVEVASLPGGCNVGNEPVTVRRNKSQKNGDTAPFQPGSALLSESAPAEVLKGKHPELREPLRRSTRNSRRCVLGNEIAVPTADDGKAIEKKCPGKRARNLLLVREVKEISGPKCVVATETAGPEKEKRSEVKKHPRRSTRSSTRVAPEDGICLTTCENVVEDDISFKMNLRKRPRNLQLVREAMQNPACKSEVTTTVAAPGGKVSEIKEHLKGSIDYPVHNILKISVPTYRSSGEAVQTVKKNKRGKNARQLHAVREAIESNAPNVEAATELEGNEDQEEAPRDVQPQVARRRSRRNARANDVSMFVDQKSGDGKQTFRQGIVRGAKENCAFNVEAATESEASEVQQEVQMVVQSEVAPRRSRRNARDNDDSMLVDREPGGDDKTVGGNKLWQLPEGGELMGQAVEATLMSNGRNGKQKREHNAYRKSGNKCNFTREGQSSASVPVKDVCPLTISSSGGLADVVFDDDLSFFVENGNTEVGNCNYLVEKKLAEMQQQSMLLDNIDGGPVQNDQMKTPGSGKLLEDSLQEACMSPFSQLGKKSSCHLEIGHEAREVSDPRFAEVFSEVAGHEYSNVVVHTLSEGTMEATSEGVLYADNKCTIQCSVIEKEELIQALPQGMDAECISPCLMTTSLKTIYDEDHKAGHEDTDIIGLHLSFSRTKELSPSDITGDSPETDQEQLTAPANNHDAQETVLHFNSCSPNQTSCHLEKTICTLSEVAINNSVAMSCTESSRNEDGTCVKASPAMSNAYSSEENDVAKSSFTSEVVRTFTPEIILSEVNVGADTGGNTNDMVEAEVGISQSSLHILASKGRPDGLLPNKGILIPVEDISTGCFVEIGSSSSCSTEGSKFSEVPVEDRDPSSLKPLGAAGEYVVVVECNNDKDLIDTIDKSSPHIDFIKPGEQAVVLQVTENDSSVSFPKSVHEYIDMEVAAVEYPGCSNVNSDVDLDDKAGVPSLGKLIVGNKDATFSLCVDLNPDKLMEARVVAMDVVAAELQSYTINGFEDGNKSLEATNTACASISCDNDEDVSSADVEASSRLDNEDPENLANAPIANQMVSHDNIPLPICTVVDQAKIVECAMGSSNTVTESSLDFQRDSIVESGTPEVEAAMLSVRFASVHHDVVSEIKEGLAEGNNSHSGEDFSLDPRKSLTSTYLRVGSLGSGRLENEEGMTNVEVRQILGSDNLASNLSSSDKVRDHRNESSAKSSARITDSLASECLDVNARSEEGASRSALAVRFLMDYRDPSASPIGCNTPEDVAKVQDSRCPLTDEEHRASTIPPSAPLENATILCDNPSMENRNFCHVDKSPVSFEELLVVSKGDRIPANYDEKPASPLEIPDSNQMAASNNVHSAVNVACSYFGTTEGLSVDDQGVSKIFARVSEGVALDVSCSQSKLEACKGQEKLEADLVEVRASQLSEAGSSELEEKHAFSLDDKDRRFYSDKSPFSLSISGDNFVAHDSEVTGSGFLAKAAYGVDDREETIDNSNDNDDREQTIDNSKDNVSTEYEDVVEKENTIDMDEFDGESVKSLCTTFTIKRINDGGEICSAATSANSLLEPPNYQVNTTKVPKAIDTHNEGSANVQSDSIKDAACQMIPGIMSSTQLDTGSYHPVNGIKEIIAEGCPQICEGSCEIKASYSFSSQLASVTEFDGGLGRGQVHTDKEVRLMAEPSESLIPEEASVAVCPLEAPYYMEMAVDNIGPSHIHTQGHPDEKTERLLSNSQSVSINVASTGGEVSVHPFTPQREVEGIKVLEKTEAADAHVRSSQLSDSLLFLPFSKPNDSQLCEVVPDLPKGTDAHCSVDDHEVCSDESSFHLTMFENGNDVNDADSASLDRSQDVIWDSLEESANAAMDIPDTAVESEYEMCDKTANDIENSDASEDEDEVKSRNEEMEGKIDNTVLTDEYDRLANISAHFSFGAMFGHFGEIQSVALTANSSHQTQDIQGNANAHDSCAMGEIDHQKTSSSQKEDCSQALGTLSGSSACEEFFFSMDVNGEKSITGLGDTSYDNTVQVDEEIFNRSAGKMDHTIHDGQATPEQQPVGCNDHGQVKEPKECDGKETEASTLLISDISLVSSKFEVIGSKEVALEVLSSGTTNSLESNCENFKENPETKDGYVAYGELNSKGTFMKAEHGCVDGDEIAPPDGSPIDYSPSLSKQEGSSACEENFVSMDVNGQKSITELGDMSYDYTVQVDEEFFNRSAGKVNHVIHDGQATPGQRPVGCNDHGQAKECDGKETKAATLLISDIPPVSSKFEVISSKEVALEVLSSGTTNPRELNCENFKESSEKKDGYVASGELNCKGTFMKAEHGCVDGDDTAPLDSFPVDCSPSLSKQEGSSACEEKIFSMDVNCEKSITELGDMSYGYTVQVDEEIFNRSAVKIDHAIHVGQATLGQQSVGCNDHGQAKEPKECDGKETEADTLLISDISLVSSKFEVIGSKEVALEVLSSGTTSSRDSTCENFKESSEAKNGYVASGELNCEGTFMKAEHGCVDGDEIAPLCGSPVDCSPSLSKWEDLNECSGSNPMEDINRRLTDFRISSAKKCDKLIESSPLKLAKSFKYHSTTDILEHKENTPFPKIDRPMKGNVERSGYASSLRRPLQCIQNNNTLGK